MTTAPGRFCARTRKNRRIGASGGSAPGNEIRRGLRSTGSNTVRQMGCLDEPTVLALIGGQLVDPQAATIDSHLDGCRACRDLVVAAARTTLTPSAIAAGSGSIEAAGSERYVLADL